MDEKHHDIKQEYLKQQEYCYTLLCKKVIFEPSTKREWFFEEDSWCWFEFYCDDAEYTLRKEKDKNFSADCFIKEMSYEIRMLLAYSRLRHVQTIEKEAFTRYVFRFERERKTDSDLTLERFNFNLKESEEGALVRSDKIANGILTGCLVSIALVAILFLYAVVAYFRNVH